MVCGGGGSSPAVYRALLNQAGTAAPVATVLENTIGAIVWSRSTDGQYIATLAGAFTTSKTALIICTAQDTGSAALVGVIQLSANAVLVSSTFDITSGSNNDDVLSNHFLQILVYP